MKYLLILFLLSLISYTVNAAKSSEDLVRDLCGLAKDDDKELTAEYCEAKLKTIPEKLGDSDEKLGLSVLKLVFTGIFEGRQQILQILQDTKLDIYSQNILAKCLDYYKDGIEDLNEAIILYKKKDYKKVDIRIADGVAQTTKCEESFSERKLKSPLTKQYNEIRRLSEIAVDVDIIIDA